MERAYKKIVLTGGPCAGKTSARVKLREWLNELGYKLIWVGEVPTEVMQDGLHPSSVSEREFQEQVIHTMLEKEARRDIWAHICKDNDHKVVVICDRGVMDARAYMPAKNFKKLCKKLGGTIIQWRDERYDAVIHMRSAALGAKDYYTCANNSMRRETVEEACITDEKTLQAWYGHPHLYIVPNVDIRGVRFSFDHKMHLVRKAVAHELGEPVPMEIERKYLVRDFDITVPYQSIYIEQTYLLSNETRTEERARKRSQNGASMYVHTIKEFIAPGERIERERIIGKHEYNDLLRRKDPQRDTIRKTRHCFVWENQYFELDEFIDPDRLTGLQLMEIELTTMQTEVLLPPFVEVIRDVTEEETYSNSTLAVKEV